MNSKITASHTERQAILYIRQSSPQQITEHEESRRLQYAMQARLKELGFVDIEVIDEDLGRSASGRVKRSGFDRMVSTVGLGRIGAVTAREVSRFARNNQEWSRLLELCSLLDVLVIDHDSVYDLRDGNDRLLLGLKGNLSEYELTIMKDRLQSAIKAKAARGEMLGKIPVGYCTSEDERVVKNPDVRVQKSIESILLKVIQFG